MSAEANNLEEIRLELDDEIAAWLESASLSQKKPVSDIIAQMIQEARTAHTSGPDDAD